jgi:hypothetical protein
MCIPTAMQWVAKHIPATHEHTPIGRLLLDNGAVKRLRQQYMLCFPLGPYKMIIREANSEAGSCRSTELVIGRELGRVFGIGICRKWQEGFIVIRSDRSCDKSVARKRTACRSDL